MLIQRTQGLKVDAQPPQYAQHHPATFLSASPSCSPFQQSSAVRIALRAELQMMSCRRRHHHHKPPSNRITTNRLHHTGTGTGAGAAAEEPMMIHSHRDDDRMRRPVVHLQPNVIARLMGIDDDAVVPTPPPPKPVASAVQFQAQRRQTNKHSLQLPYYSYRGVNDDPEYSGSSSRICVHKMMVVPRSWSRSSRLHRRRHPQEELLQKMRQDLQAWQASKAPALLQTSSSSCTRPSDSGGGGRSLVLQAIAQEDLRKQKMARYGFGFGLGGHAKVTQQHELPLIMSKKDGVAQGDTSEHAAAASEPAAMPDDRDLDARRDGHGRGHGHVAPAAQAQELLSHGHTPIVLLKPATCSESDTTGGVAIGGGQKTSVLLGLPKLHRDANMSMLLQEVRDRVQRELTVLTAATGGEVIKAPTWAAIPPLQVTKETKEDRGKRRLFRSESFRAFRSDRRRSAATTHASPEAYILMKSQTVSPAHEESMTTSDASLSVLRPPGVGGVTDGQSFRSECLTLTKHKDDDAVPSPRLLFRSFSAPESGFSFSSLGNRLFGDSISSSARSTRHGASERAAAAVTLTTKNVVSASLSSLIRGTVSSLRHSFSSKRNLPFRRKTYWSNKASLAEIHPAKMEMPVTSPSHETFSLFKVAQASLSELPPSPVSPLEVAAGHSSRHFFTDLHFTLPELSPKCLSQFVAPATASESSPRTDITAVEMACSRDKAYITELLIAAGLYDDYDGPFSANARVDSMARPMPICDDVFEDVEDMYYYRGDYIVGGGMYDGTAGGTTAATDHRMLFDLANEALQSLVVESSRAGSSSLRRWVVDSTGVARGKKLVDDVWEQVQALKNPQAQEMQTIDGMVAYEVRRSVWTEVLYEDVYVVGRKIERAIFDELIEDLFACAEVFI